MPEHTHPKHTPQAAQALNGLDEAKRKTLIKLAQSAAFVMPVVASFSMDGLMISRVHAHEKNHHHDKDKYSHPNSTNVPMHSNSTTDEDHHHHHHHHKKKHKDKYSHPNSTGW
jgi:hypothetical protein